MAFGRSASGPGSLSINTGSANSLFGSTTTQSQPAAGLFGALSSAAPPAQASGLFGAKSTAAPQAGNMFGSTATTSQPAAGGMFGSQPAAGGGGLFGMASSSQPQQASGLFGAMNAQSQPQQTSGLFGMSTQQQAQSQTQPTGGLFGSILQPSNPQPASGGLFGNMGNTQTQPQQTGGSSLFGSLGQSQNQQSKPSGGLFSGFGQTQTPSQQPASGGLFGNINSANNANNIFSQSTQQATPSLFSSTTNNLNQANIPTIPGVKIDLSNLRPTTRFSDLHESLQAEISALDDMILTQQQHAQQCSGFMTNHATALSSLPDDTLLLTHRLAFLNSMLENDALAIAHVRDLTASDAGDARLSFRAVDNLKLPAQYHHNPPSSHSQWTGSASANTGGSINSSATARVDSLGTDDKPKDLVGFFSARASAMSSALDNYVQTVQAIESHLRGMEARTAQQTQAFLLQQSRGTDGRYVGNGEPGKNGPEGRSAEDQVRELASVLREFEGGILGVAGKVGAAREGVQELVFREEGLLNGASYR